MYTTESSSGAITYTPSYINIGSCIQKLIGRGGGEHRQQGNLICLLLFLSKYGSRLNMYANIVHLLTSTI
jgi:hypothetical protein